MLASIFSQKWVHFANALGDNNLEGSFAVTNSVQNIWPSYIVWVVQNMLHPMTSRRPITSPDRPSKMSQLLPTRWSKNQNSTSKQCDKIGLLLKPVMTNFLTKKVAQNFATTFGVFWNYLLSRENFCGYFWIKMGLLFIPTFGRTMSCVQHRSNHFDIFLFVNFSKKKFLDWQTPKETFLLQQEGAFLQKKKPKIDVIKSISKAFHTELFWQYLTQSNCCSGANIKAKLEPKFYDNT